MSNPLDLPWRVHVRDSTSRDPANDEDRTFRMWTIVSHGLKNLCLSSYAEPDPEPHGDLPPDVERMYELVRLINDFGEKL